MRVSKLASMHLSRVQLIRFLVISAALSIIVGACTQQAGDDTSTTQADATTTEQPPEAPAVAGSRLVIIHPNTLDSIDPDQNIGGSSLPPLPPLYDRLISIEPSTGTLRPELATSWEKDSQFLEMSLREDVVFQDGATFDAETVQINIERSKTEGLEAQAASFASAIEEVEIVDDFTVRLHRSSETSDIAWALIEYRLAEQIGYMISPDALNNPEFDLDRNAAGSGPFELVNMGPNGLELRRWDGYWGRDGINLSELNIVWGISDPESILNSLISGEVHLAKISPLQVGTADEAGLKVETVSSWRVIQVWNDHGMPPFDDENFRMAINYAIDREGIVETIADGLGVPTIQAFPPNNPGYHPGFTAEDVPYDPNRARELVAASSYADGHPPIRMQLANFDPFVPIAEAVQAMLADVGITVELRVIEPALAAEWFDRVNSLFIGERARVTPLQHLFDNSDVTSSFNIGGLTTDEIQSLLDQAAGTPIGPEHFEIVQEASKALAEGGYQTTIYSPLEVWASDPCVVDFDYPVTVLFDVRDGVSINAGC